MTVDQPSGVFLLWQFSFSGARSSSHKAGAAKTELEILAEWVKIEATFVEFFCKKIFPSKNRRENS